MSRIAIIVLLSALFNLQAYFVGGTRHVYSVSFDGLSSAELMRRLILFSIGAVFAIQTFVSAAATSTSVVDSSELDCLIEPYAEVEVSSPVVGILETIAVDRGDLVKRDQTLARLRSGVEKANVKVARARAKMNEEIDEGKARLAFAQRRQARTDDLFKRKVISFEDKDQADTDLILAQSQLSIAKANKGLAALELERAIETLKMRTVRSPIKGVVVERFLSPGESTENGPILKLAQIDPLNVELIAPVEMFGSITRGMLAYVMPENPEGHKYKAIVRVVDRVIDAASGTFGVRLELPNPERKIPAGMKCRVKF